MRTEVLLTLPPAFAGRALDLEGLDRGRFFAASDPPGLSLGSGGGACHLLVEAWKASSSKSSFWEWLSADKKLVIHGGGKSRRLPAYAAVGKLFMPVPVFRWALGQRLDQKLIDLQLPSYERVLEHASSTSRVMVCSGDVLLRFGRELPCFPEVDVLGLGMWVTPEVARNFGVFFCGRETMGSLEFFLQKPSPARIRELGAEHLYMIDTGMWLLSSKALGVMMRKVGWDPDEGSFPPENLRKLDLYSEFGLALGRRPVQPDPEISALTSAVVPLPKASFFHLGTTRQMIEAISALQNVELDETKLGSFGARRHPDQYLLNSQVEVPLRQEENHTLWIENAHVPKSWHLRHDHVLTGAPKNDWELDLEPGTCLDFVPVGEDAYCVRFYGMDDSFAGDVWDIATKWLGKPAPNWFFGRAIRREEAGLSPGMDIQEAPLFPVLERSEISSGFLRWLTSRVGGEVGSHAVAWLNARRLSASDIQAHANLGRVYQSRAARQLACVEPMRRNFRWSVFHRLDLEETARRFAASNPAGFGEVEPPQGTMLQVRDAMFRAAVRRHQGADGGEALESSAFATLQELIVEETRLRPAEPRKALVEDQIIWARSPVRLDLAGGWTDTPPYCLEHGGRVLNVAVDLNGQPPIQVFVKLGATREIVFRSIDLGVERRVSSYGELENFGEPGSDFGLAKVACALAGFLPRFGSGARFGSLREQLDDFGGGIEISMLCAVPKGSGLGTSSILASTLLAALGEACGLGWDKGVLFQRTLALEQLLTTGGGWQDQAGGLHRGVKLLETSAGLDQALTLRWCPEHLFDSGQANRAVLLYFTGITRLAKNILKEIVRGMFLNSPSHLSILEDIGDNALAGYDAVQRSDLAGLLASVRQAWSLNQRLDSGTNPPQIAAILDLIRDETAACKLLGAGGGGYLLIFAKDELAGARIKQKLTENPPNERARFVNLSVSPTGLQLTRS